MPALPSEIEGSTTCMLCYAAVLGLAVAIRVLKRAMIAKPEDCLRAPVDLALR